METRSFQLAELRAEDTDTRRVRGTAIVYGQDADLKVFHERVSPGALRSVLSSGKNMRLLFEHDRRGLLASTEAGSLKVHDTADGLSFEARVAETSVGNDVLTLVRGGELRGMSFGFRVAKGGQRFSRENGKLTRTITEFSEVPEITITSAPAYSDTAVSHRSIDAEAIAEAERMLGRASLATRRRQLMAAQAAA